jgi:hypothetical protein
MAILSCHHRWWLCSNLRGKCSCPELGTVEATISVVGKVMKTGAGQPLSLIAASSARRVLPSGQGQSQCQCCVRLS